MSLFDQLMRLSPKVPRKVRDPARQRLTTPRAFWRSAREEGDRGPLSDIQGSYLMPFLYVFDVEEVAGRAYFTVSHPGQDQLVGRRLSVPAAAYREARG
jgi:hypothetical protein